MSRSINRDRALALHCAREDDATITSYASAADSFKAATEAAAAAERRVRALSATAAWDAAVSLRASLAARAPAEKPMGLAVPGAAAAPSRAERAERAAAYARDLDEAVRERRCARVAETESDAVYAATAAVRDSVLLAEAKGARSAAARARDAEHERITRDISIKAELAARARAADAAADARAAAEAARPALEPGRAALDTRPLRDALRVQMVERESREAEARAADQSADVAGYLFGAVVAAEAVVAEKERIARSREQKADMMRLSGVVRGGARARSDFPQ